MLIQSYGLFWDRDGVEWSPGSGTRRHLWGRRNKYRPALRVGDAWGQHGLYVLYSYTGPYYVGIARRQTLGKRLADHTRDDLYDWRRFSWFGFLPMSDEPGEISQPDHDAESMKAPTRDELIADMEALLIKSMGTFNINNLNFRDATEWDQIFARDAHKWIERIESDGF